MKLKMFRKAKNLSQEAFAGWLTQETGLTISQTMVSYWENGGVPRKSMREAIDGATKGKIKPASFL